MSNNTVGKRKRPPSDQSSSLGRSRSIAIDPPGDNNKNNTTTKTNTRYQRLLSILAKSLSASREKIASDATATINDSYGDLTSLFTSSEDGVDGTSRLVDLLLGKLDSVHDRFNSDKAMSSGITSLTETTTSTSSSSVALRLEEILQKQNIRTILHKLETAIENVERAEREFEASEEADKHSAREAIQIAKSNTRLCPNTGKKRRVSPAESIGYQAYKLKMEYQTSLVRELEEIEAENTRLEEELKHRWEGWKENVEGVKGALEMLDALSRKDGGG